MKRTKEERMNVKKICRLTVDTKKAVHDVDTKKLIGKTSIDSSGLRFPAILNEDGIIKLTHQQGKLGGTIHVEGGERISLGSAEDGDLTKCKMNYFDCTKFDSDELMVNSTYYVRGCFVKGKFEIYVVLGQEIDKAPPTLTGFELSGKGGFDSNKLDILLAEIITAEAGKDAEVTMLINVESNISSILLEQILYHDPDNKWSESDERFPLNLARKPNITPTLCGFSNDHYKHGDPKSRNIGFLSLGSAIKVGEFNRKWFTFMYVYKCRESRPGMGLLNFRITLEA